MRIPGTRGAIQLDNHVRTVRSVTFIATATCGTRRYRVELPLGMDVRPKGDHFRIEKSSESHNTPHPTANHALAALCKHSLPKASASIRAGVESFAAILPHQRWYRFGSLCSATQNAMR